MTRKTDQLPIEDEIEELEPEPEPAAGPLPDARITAVLEALLFACEEPVTLDDMTTILGDDRRDEIKTTLESLVVRFDRQDSGLRVQKLAGGYRMTTEPELGPFIREMVRSKNRKRLSRAALETLAIIAYKQPITGPEVQEIRGVNPSSILNTLLDRRMVRILGRKKVVGKPFLYGTTQEFLIRFGLNSLDDLPSMEEFDALLQTAVEVDEEPRTGTGDTMAAEAGAPPTEDSGPG